MKNAIYASNAVARLAKPVAAALLFMTLLSAPAAQAAGGTPKDAPVEVTYIGSVEGKPLIRISVDNPQGETAILTLRDEDGNLIYSDTIRDKNYARTLQFDELSNNLKVRLTLRSKGETQTKIFAITTSTRTVSDVAVVNL